MQTQALILVAVAVLVGCTAEVSNEPAPPSTTTDAIRCEPIFDTYEISLAERPGGTCGKIANMVLDRWGSGDGCSVQTNVEACSAYAWIVCSTAGFDHPATTTIDADCIYSANARSMSCVFKLTTIDNTTGAKCESTYDVKGKAVL